MGILGAAAQLLHRASKTPIAGKFMQRTGNFLQRNFNPVSAQGYKQSLKNLGPTGRANIRDINRTGLRELSDVVRSGSSMPTVRNVGRGLMGIGIADALSKGDYGTAATEAALFNPGNTLGALKSVGSSLFGPVGGALVKPVLGAGALFAAVEGLAPARVADGTLSALPPEEREALEAKTRSKYEKMSDPQKRKMGITPADPLVTRLPDSSPFVPDSNNLPSSPEAVVANPLQQKMAEYEQGRAKATTQEEMDAVRDLGMSIHQAANPQMYEESYNPLMAATFPERYNKTPEDFILQGGIQAPRGMSDKDARQATAVGNKIQTMQSAEVESMYNPSRLQKL